ncbi:MULTISPECIES: hypothetical protein [Okeania]|uniref:Uncharacterized protein n=1 Tax=Okeania hirsuta TaxID=1458930 RepID=A0A3N6NTG1_9CYAN|nr:MULTISPECIES: hypothetical protein [Okeania]NET16555.1 hypothetical protein [Okeania sp. SIO1H6]NES78676.1 hypothetical protein [Okeania sp. SIO1H4]NES92102.1 hypothetical protein [Okeania sp. SIO2B9]NET22195.1 hypothetical protein [Okeania sp. SIO1H5]NET80353.1 hypothetical protein [Okeania sp. SIO1F9]
MLKIAIDGLDAVQATEEILEIEGIEGSYKIDADGNQKGIDLATILTIVGIGSGTSVIINNTLTIAEKIFQCFKKHEKKLEKVEIVSGEKRLLLKDATVEQIKDILESFG